MDVSPQNPPSRAMLRKRLGEVFRRAVDLDAFLLDHFPDVHRRFTADMDRVARTTLLLELKSPEEIWAALERYDKQPVRARRLEVLNRQVNESQEDIEERRKLQMPTKEEEERRLRLSKELRKGPQVKKDEELLNQRYVLLEKLGEGGFGEVWQALDRAATVPEREIVAIKVLLGKHHKDNARERRFERGAKTMRELQPHPHIVNVFDGPHQDDEVRFFVMEYLPGGNLREAVKARSLDSTRRIEIILQIGAALQHAHANKHLHRDVTPANILLDADGNAKLCDFDLVLPKEHSTVAGENVYGTLAYAAPELFENDTNPPAEKDDIHTHARLDIFALAMTALYALTGREIFPVNRESRVQQELARLSVGSEMRAVLKKALAAKPEDRYQKMDVFCNALRLAWARQRHPSSVRRWPLAAAGLLLSVAAAGAWTLARLPTPSPGKGGDDRGMQRISGGSFMMGAGDLTDEEKPEHPERVGSFAIDVTEVTVDAFAECVKAGRCIPLKEGGACNWGREERRNHPANCVSWLQAAAYCSWAGKRLPTEKEWEYAARGSGRMYPWGSEEPEGRVCWDRSTSLGTCPVRDYPAGKTPEGLYDMSGNVWEWVEDPWRSCYRASCSSDSARHAVRGGSWKFKYLGAMRAANRSGYETATQFDYIGFRCARSE